jgi:arabinan endo-1,5-alpha-L-arabinosidase
LYWDETIEGENTGSNISVATSPDLSAGSWTVYGLLDLPTNANYNLIDPNLLMVPASGDTPQTYYLSFGSYWDDIFQVNMSDPFTVSSSPTNIEFNNTGTLEYGSNPSEGSYQFSWTIEDVTYYYLFFSSGWTLVTEIVIPAGDEYKIMVCRSLTPTGPFKDADGKNCLTDNGGTLVLGSHDYVYAPGGQGVFVDPDVDGGSVILYYHYGKLIPLLHD